ncbi:uncharacterized protein LOC120208396 [Hibiscus syriacus]|uniref:uncharacterized protein LOC120208396 n=1 Tax=Hibiscus syriacus TaxID=106335 RepID=UPI0019210B5D|nr:uncharacterized protein LOC120208396 [Hibiscus syriacus]
MERVVLDCPKSKLSLLKSLEAPYPLNIATKLEALNCFYLSVLLTGTAILPSRTANLQLRPFFSFLFVLFCYKSIGASESCRVIIIIITPAAKISAMPITSMHALFAENRSIIPIFSCTEGIHRFAAKSAEKNRLRSMKRERRTGDPVDL